MFKLLQFVQEMLCLKLKNLQGKNENKRTTMIFQKSAVCALALLFATTATCEVGGGGGLAAATEPFQHRQQRRFKASKKDFKKPTPSPVTPPTPPHSDTGTDTGTDNTGTPAPSSSFHPTETVKPTWSSFCPGSEVSCYCEIDCFNEVAKAAFCDCAEGEQCCATATQSPN